MAHPKRVAMVSDLLERLDRPATVVWDEINDRHDTGARSMAAYDPSCTHHLVIQDDALPCRDVVLSAERLLTYVPEDNPVSLYLGNAQPFRRAVNAAVARADDEDVSFVVMDGIYWGPGIIVPTSTLPDLLAWYETKKAKRFANYDNRTSVFYERLQVPCWYPWPSLVDHRGDESIVDAGKRARHAHRFIGDNVSAKRKRWDGAVLRMTGTAKLDVIRQKKAGAFGR